MLSQPYTQYTGSAIANCELTTTQQESTKAAILQIINEAGISIESSSCYANNGEVGCYIGNKGCGITNNGVVNCIDDDVCYVVSDGSA